MTTAPLWDDSGQGDLLALVALGPMAPATADAEWDHYVAALRTAADHDGRISPNVLRPLVRDHVAPRRIGAFANRALSLGLIELTGEWEISTDRQGRNAGRPARTYRLGATQ